MQAGQTHQHRITLILGVTIGAILVGAIVWNIVYNVLYSANLTMSVAPNDAVITLNDKIISNKNQRIRPGDYVLRVEREGFETQEEEFSVSRDETFDAWIALLPTDGNFDWYNNNPRDAMILDGSFQREQDAIIRNAMDSNPLLALLPYTENEFGLIYIIEASYNNGVQLLIRLNTCSDMVAENYKERALLWIASQGFRPENYPITYVTLCE
jgi:hypothetical protein